MKTMIAILLSLPMWSWALPPNMKMSNVQAGFYQRLPYKGDRDQQCGLQVKPDVAAKTVSLMTVSNPVSRVYCPNEGQLLPLACDDSGARVSCTAIDPLPVFGLEPDGLQLKGATINFYLDGSFDLSMERGLSDTAKATYNYQFQFVSAGIRQPILFINEWEYSGDHGKTYQDSCIRAHQIAKANALHGCRLYGYKCEEIEKEVSDEIPGYLSCEVRVVLKAKNVK